MLVGEYEFIFFCTFLRILCGFVRSRIIIISIVIVTAFTTVLVERWSRVHAICNAWEWHLRGLSGASVHHHSYILYNHNPGADYSDIDVDYCYSFVEEVSKMSQVAVNYTSLFVGLDVYKYMDCGAGMSVGYFGHGAGGISIYRHLLVDR